MRSRYHANTYPDERALAEPEEAEEDGESSDEAEADFEPHDDEDAQLSADEEEGGSQVRIEFLWGYYISLTFIEKTVVSVENPTTSDSEEEDIVVQLRQEERDPEADAEFDLELAKMMADSLDSRKFERKPVFDVPLPIRRAGLSREPTVGSEMVDVASPTTQGTMAFSLLTKKGNRQQVSPFYPLCIDNYINRSQFNRPVLLNYLQIPLLLLQ